MNIISRSEWGAAAPGRLQGWGAGQPSSWTLHYEGVDVPTDLADYSDRVRSIQSYHMRNGYVDIAYNFLVAPNGQCFEGRGWQYRSGAQASGNPVSLAVCYLGGPGTPLTDNAKLAINRLIAHKPLPVFPHRYWLATGCPGEQIVAWIDAGRPDSGGHPPIVGVPAVSHPAHRAIVRPGARGDSVRQMQDLLRAHGFDPGPSDGIYGNNTGRSLRSFQRAQNIAADGVCGPITWERLGRPAVGGSPAPVPAVPAPSSGRLIRQGDRGAEVAAIQEALFRAGEDAGPADGIAGPRFTAAVRRFQQSRGLQVDGVVGPQTRQALGI